MLPVAHKEHCGVPSNQLPNPGIQREPPRRPILGDGEERIVRMDLDPGTSAQGCEAVTAQTTFLFFSWLFFFNMKTRSLQRRDRCSHREEHAALRLVFLRRVAPRGIAVPLARTQATAEGGDRDCKLHSGRCRATIRLTRNTRVVWLCRSWTRGPSGDEKDKMQRHCQLSVDKWQRVLRRKEFVPDRQTSSNRLAASSKQCACVFYFRKVKRYGKVRK